MGVIPTGTIYKTLAFDGKSSSEFNVYITGEAAFNAPERAVEMISIPGRNGSFALDHGRFENIEVTYQCGIAADDETDFASAISDFRNWLCSRNGYVRLTDDYNTGEYRMAMYKSGLEVETTQLIAGEFPVTFECKPQRFLTSGETAVAITSGDDITNPTVFNASPLLEVTGHGEISWDSQTISVSNVPIGLIKIGNYSDQWNGLAFPYTYTKTVDVSNLNAGDTIKGDESDEGFSFAIIDIENTSIHNVMTVSPGATTNGTSRYEPYTSGTGRRITQDKLSFIYGTSSTVATTFQYSVEINNITYTGQTTITTVYDGNDTFTYTVDDTSTSTEYSVTLDEIKTAGIYANSTKSALGNPAYIDLDIGEAWNEDSGTPVSINNAVSLPAELPKFSPGNTTITFDNTITKLEIIPRWWKV